MHSTILTTVTLEVIRIRIHIHIRTHINTHIRFHFLRNSKLDMYLGYMGLHKLLYLRV